VRAYDAYSRKVGTHEDTEGQIYIEPQGMCVMAGIGLDDGKAQQALKSVKERLTCDWGTAILAPAYSTYRIELGEISSYPRGYKENGGIFCHNNPWISIANAIAGNDDEAFAVYQRNCPAYVEDKSNVRKVEPYVYCQMVAGPEAATPGEGKNSWLTGTAAWTFVDVSQYLLGVRPTLDGLAIEPHLPERFDQLTVTRVFRGVTYRIAMKRTGERTVSVDGAKIGGNVVPALSDAKSVDVEVTFGCEHQNVLTNGAGLHSPQHEHGLPEHLAYRLFRRSSIGFLQPCGRQEPIRTVRIRVPHRRPHGFAHTIRLR
ncbi:hypothetical protein PNC72_12920, partial [Enterococcus faecium]|nr:hypothetical protein [Enterococcus faecium]